MITVTEDLRAKKRAYNEAYYQRTRKRQCEQRKEYYKANREAVKKQSAATRQRMRENAELRVRYNARVKARLDANGGIKRRANRKAQQQWQEKNADWFAERTKTYHADYYKNNREMYFLYDQKRKALKAAATINLQGMKDFVKAVKAKPSAICYYCQKRVPTSEIHLDHIIPLSKGGMHAVENLCVACKHCNLTKWAKPMADWAREHLSQQLLNL